MLIKEVQDISEIIKCLPFEIEIQRKGRDNGRASHLISFIQTQLNNPFFKFLIAYDEESEENIIGYTIATINTFPESKGLYIYRIYAYHSDILKKLMEMLHIWAKEYKIKTEYITVCKNVEALKRKKYGFSQISVNMKRRI